MNLFSVAIDGIGGTLFAWMSWFDTVTKVRSCKDPSDGFRTGRRGGSEPSGFKFRDDKVTAGKMVSVLVGARFAYFGRSVE